MITLRRAKERQHQRHRKQETWLTFSPHDLASPLVDGGLYGFASGNAALVV